MDMIEVRFRAFESLITHALTLQCYREYQIEALSKAITLVAQGDCDMAMMDAHALLDKKADVAAMWSPVEANARRLLGGQIAERLRNAVLAYVNFINKTKSALPWLQALADGHAESIVSKHGQGPLDFLDAIANEDELSHLRHVYSPIVEAVGGCAASYCAIRLQPNDLYTSVNAVYKYQAAMV